MNKSIDTRLRVLGIILIIWGMIIIASLWYMQVVKGEGYEKKAARNRIRLVRVPPPRGTIFDRNGKVLADNRPSFDVMVNPTEIDNREKLIKTLEEILEIPSDILAKRLDTFKTRPFEPVRIAADIGLESATILEEMSPALAGIGVQVNPIRNYPYGSVPVHVIGYVGQINPRELIKLSGAGYRAQDDIGKMGIEDAYDPYLKGTSGVEQLQVNARGYRDKLLSRKDPHPGDNIFLSLDIRAQIILNELMDEWKGAAVVLDPRNGDILAMVSRPSFEPNLLIRPVRQEDIDGVFSNPDAPVLNRVLAGEYPPGSPFKLVVALAGLRDGVISPRTTYDCHGVFILGQSAWRCGRSYGHGPVNLREAIQYSCNTYFYNLGLELGVDRISETARDIGFGEVAGMEIGGERAGLVPDRVWKKKNIKEPWYPGDTVNMSIGQGYLLVTPLQMAELGCMIANKGILYRPRIVNKISSPEGEVIKESKPEIWKEIDFPEGIRREIISGMIRVVNSPSGTGQAAAHPAVTVAGKTGTIQVGIPPDYTTHAWFLALAPAENPEVVIAVLLEDAESGGQSAAPLVGKFLKEYFRRDIVPFTGWQEIDNFLPSNYFSNFRGQGSGRRGFSE